MEPFKQPTVVEAPTPIFILMGFISVRREQIFMFQNSVQMASR